MSHALSGTWCPYTDRFIPENPRHAWVVETVVTKFAFFLKELSAQYDHDAEQILDALGITDSLADRAGFATNYHIVSTITSLPNKQQYEAYIWLLSVFKHLHYSGDFLWDNRAVLLDQSEPMDWLVFNSVYIRNKKGE